MLFFQYLPKLPVPENINDVAYWDDNCIKQFDQETGEVVYGVWDLPKNINQWIDQNVLVSRDNIHTVDCRTIQPSILPSMLRIHTDFARRWVLSCIIDTGGPEVYTNFYIENQQPLIRDLGTKVVDGPNMNKLYSVKIQKGRWHLLNTAVLHSVTGIQTTRKALHIGIVAEDPFECIRGY